MIVEGEARKAEHRIPRRTEFPRTKKRWRGRDEQGEGETRERRGRDEGETRESDREASLRAALLPRLVIKLTRTRCWQKNKRLAVCSWQLCLSRGEISRILSRLCVYTKIPGRQIFHACRTKIPEIVRHVALLPRENIFSKFSPLLRRGVHTSIIEFSFYLSEVNGEGKYCDWL